MGHLKWSHKMESKMESGMTFGHLKDQKWSQEMESGMTFGHLKDQ